MKTEKSKMGSLVALALIGLSHAAQAQVPIVPRMKFTPLEQLSLEQRSQYEPLIRTLDQSVRIDWGSVILGVDENGKLVIRDRKSVDIEAVSEPSCWTAPY